MRLLRMVWMRARALFRADAVDRDLDTEMREHVDRLVEDHIARGMPPERALAAARQDFGPMTQLVEESREARGVWWVSTLRQDLGYGLRLMARAPAFAVAAVATVAVGIAATTAMFSVVYGVLLRPLPYPNADRLVNVWSTAPRRGFPRAPVGMANVYDWKARNHVFDDLAALRPLGNFNIVGQGEPERLNGARVSSNLFPLLGVTPLLGRLFTEEEDDIGHETVALLTYGLWAGRFGGDPGVVGRSISLNGVAHTVVGVMRPDFAFPGREFQIYVPLTFNPEELIDRAPYSYQAVARLKAGVSLAQAQAELTLISSQMEREHPKENEGVGAEVVPMLADTVGALRRPLYVLLASVGAMLLIGCANLANLLLARALARRRELAVRTALGASRRRVGAQAVIELVPVLAAGGALGLLGAWWGMGALLRRLPADLPRLENVGLHLPVLAAAAATLALVAVLVALWPALELSRVAVGASADLTRGGTPAPDRTRVRDGLVVAQIAATLWLVVGATLLARSFAELKRVDPGFNPAGVYTVHLAIPRTKYRTDRDVAAFVARVLDRVRTLPAVTAAGMVNRLPLAGGAQTGQIEFEGVDPRYRDLPNVDYRTITPDYFRALEIPLLAGRAFTDRDDETAPRVAIIDERLAKTVFGGASPVGRRARLPVMNLPWLTIVGVVGHVRHDRLEEDTRPQVYFNYRQRAQDRMALAIRSRTDPSALAGPLAAAIRSVDPEQPVYDARTLEAVVDRSIAQRWLQTTVLSAFAAIGLLLASIGIYGVVAFAVGQRRREFGIRIALGADRRGIVGLVMRRGARLFAAGAAIGLIAAVATARVLGSLLYNVPTLDPVSFSAATLILLAVAAAACGLPARRAAAIDPSITLRAE